MTDAEKAAMAWLNIFTVEDNLIHVRTLKTMLAEPRLPKEPTPEILKVMGNHHHADWRSSVYRALYAHLTKPKTKTVWAVHCENAPAAALFERWSDATRELFRLVDLGKRATIERREVPNA